MLKVNEYFNGQVKSIALTNSEGSLTMGVMEVGEYEFSTTQDEEMSVVSGSLQVLLPGDPALRTFHKGQSFNVPAKSSFQVKVEEQSAYLCRYMD
ncbi:pyrimidine/purine nucleoside phosphorylase [Marinospirillum insulare]|uniref:Pyrimidine/purine nucleoside phosphorylase n=1 Tax=Marinospirillum insulare TaxID=217169 RepID=A0ABQ5ZXQ3_9GAMM|nr:pyrimidine/purine nucleoside phosphorylase [Marinospirillum insulare]GLR64271.1 UPF0345 protein [Marinospirillum insulare]